MPFFKNTLEKILDCVIIVNIKIIYGGFFMPEKIKSLYKKYEDIILYIFFGGLTTLVSWGTHFASRFLLEVPVSAATLISWICSVTFAFITNKKFVFKNKTETTQGLVMQTLSFYAARALSLGVEMIIMYLCADKFSEFFCSLFFGISASVNEMIFKVLANIVILIMNYALSKLVIFKNKNTETAGQ